VDQLVAPVAAKECYAYATELTPQLNDTERWSEAQREALHFVQAVLMMGLRPDETAEPYHSMWQIDASRSALPVDFPREWLTPLLPWATALRDAELRAPFLDLLWVQARAYPAARDAVPVMTAAGSGCDVRAPCA